MSSVNVEKHQKKKPGKSEGKKCCDSCPIPGLSSHVKKQRKQIDSCFPENAVLPFVNEIQSSDALSALSSLYASLLPPSLHPLDAGRHEFLTLIQLSPPSLQYHIIDVTAIPGRRYEVVIEVSDALIDSLVSCTKYLKALNDVKQQSILQPSVVRLETRFGRYICSKINNSMNYDVDVCLPSGQDFIVLKCLTDDHWYRLTQMAPLSCLFSRFLCASCRVNPNSVSKDGLQHLVVSTSYECYTKYATDPIGALVSQLGLCLEDEIIILKEALYPVGFLLITHSFFEEYQSVLLSVLENKTFLALNITKWLKDDIEGQEMYDIYMTYARESFRFLREDFFVVIILCVFCIFEDRPGLSSTTLLAKERSFYCDLLDSYINAMILSGHWTVSRNLIWDNLNRMISIIPRYTRFITDLRRRLQCSLDYSVDSGAEHEFLRFKPHPSSKILFSVKHLQGTWPVDYEMTVEFPLTSGVIIGTEVSCEDLNNLQREVSGMKCESNNTTSSILQTRGGQKTFRRNQDSFDVEVSSTASKSKIRMQLDNNLWMKLGQVIRASDFLANVLKPTCSFLPTSFMDVRQVRFHFSWQTFKLNISQVLNNFDSFTCLLETDKEILRNECMNEVFLIQAASQFNKTSNSIAFVAVPDHLDITVRLDRQGTDEESKPLLLRFFQEFNDCLRRDGVIVTILSLLSVFTAREGLSDAIAVQEERNKLLDLLSKYIDAKIQFKEWIASYDIFWCQVIEIIRVVSTIRTFE